MPKVSVNAVGLVAIFCLGIALVNDLNAWLMPGSFTADAYYLPLAKFVPPADKRQMEDLVIDIHTQLLRRQSLIFGIIHGVSMVAMVVLVVAVNQKKRRLPPVNLAE